MKLKDVICFLCFFFVCLMKVKFWRVIIHIEEGSAGSSVSACSISHRRWLMHFPNLIITVAFLQQNLQTFCRLIGLWLSWSVQRLLVFLWPGSNYKIFNVAMPFLLGFCDLDLIASYSVFLVYVRFDASDLISRWHKHWKQNRKLYFLVLNVRCTREQLLVVVVVVVEKPRNKLYRGHSLGLCIFVLKNSPPESKQLTGRVSFLCFLSVCVCFMFV